jgi:hypothetical protein
VIGGKVDESKLKGSIVRRCYDVILSEEQKGKMDEIVNRANVYEEDSSVFVLGVSEEDQENEGDNGIAGEMGIVVDKFDYIKKQIDKIHHEAVDNAKLLELMREYYERAS